MVIDLAEPGGDYDIPALQIRAQHMLPRLRRTVRDAHRIGVKIVTGSDTSYGPKSLTRIPEEIVNLTTMGLSPLEAIQAATTVNAEMLQLDKEIGQVAPGFQADLIAVDGNPLNDIDTIEDVLLVVSNGHVAVNRLDFRKHPADVVRPIASAGGCCRRGASACVRGGPRAVSMSAPAAVPARQRVRCANRAPLASVSAGCDMIVRS